MPGCARITPLADRSNDAPLAGCQEGKLPSRAGGIARCPPALAVLQCSDGWLRQRRVPGRAGEPVAATAAKVCEQEERPRRVGTMRSVRAWGRAMATGIVLGTMLGGNNAR